MRKPKDNRTVAARAQRLRCDRLSEAHVVAEMLRLEGRMSPQAVTGGAVEGLRRARQAIMIQSFAGADVLARDLLSDSLPA